LDWRTRYSASISAFGLTPATSLSASIHAVDRSSVGATASHSASSVVLPKPAALPEIRILTASLDVRRDRAPDLLVDGDLVDTGDRLKLLPARGSH
jgi:hypothetical protein